MEPIDGVEVLFFEDDDRLEAWLAEHHGLAAGVWLKLAKKSSGIRSVTPGQVIDVALCYGWIDGQRRSLDATYYLQKITPRRPRSQWSQVNVGKVAALEEAGRMRDPGRAQVEAAKADGRWDAAYESQRTARVPPDLAAALDAAEKAKAFFERLNKTDRYGVILQLLRARTPAARAAKLESVMALLEAERRPQ
ncbi:YdeI/OmpD-associated family protein [Streptomyces sp. NBC_00306]|uniref:YdeI/OmpD-associated family protein n=1 Tax=Streptomyces sp. NBC_00306 TaxID=2975708 RepID=UPI002E2BE496|nr:YdeI/OmpD-associated family protein [Streptomyces sp. NBC_00306]